MKSPPRRRKPSAAARMRRFWIAALVVVAVLAGAAAGIVLWPGFYPKELAISGNRIVPRLEIVERANVAPNVNMWLQNPNAIAARVEAIPYVDVAVVHRIPPATISIAVTERVPYAVVRSGLQWALVDRNLRVLEMAAGPSASLPVIDASPGTAFVAGSVPVDPGLSELRDDADAMAAAHVDAAWIGRDRYGELLVTLRTGVRVQLGGSEDLERKLALVEPIVEQAGHNRAIASIDLRAPNTPVVVYKK